MTNFLYRDPLLLEKDVLNATVVAGTLVTYTLVLRNLGALTLTSVIISDNLPLNFTYVDSSVTMVNAFRTLTVSPLAGQSDLIWGEWTIESGGMVTINVLVNVANLATMGAYDNTVFVVCAQSEFSTDDGLLAQGARIPWGHEAEEKAGAMGGTMGGTMAGLSLNKHDEIDPIVAGDLLTYTILITNSGLSKNCGPSEVTDIVSTDTLPNWIAFQSAALRHDPEAGLVPCHDGTIAIKSTVPRTILIWVDPGFTGQRRERQRCFTHSNENNVAQISILSAPTPQNDLLIEPVFACN